MARVSRKLLKQLQQEGRLELGPVVKMPSAGPRGKSRSEKVAEDYLVLSRSPPLLLYEPIVIRLRNTSYKPDLVIFWDLLRRDLFEVKEVWRNKDGHIVGKGFRIRETRAKLSWVKEKTEPWGWRVFLLLVDRGSVTEQEIA